MHPDGMAGAEPRTTVQLLGGFALTTLEHPIALPQGAQRLVAFLALHPRAPGRATAAARLWPDLPDERAGATLRTTLWQVRRRAPGIISGDSACVRLSTVAVDVDLWRAERYARDLVREPLSDGNGGPGPEAASLPPVDLFRLDLLPDWTGEWIEVDRERFRQTRLHALERMCRAMSDCGRTVAAIDLALHAVAADPLRETAQRALIEAHLADGNLSEAVRQYRSYASDLRASLGVEPTAHLTALDGMGAGAPATDDRGLPLRDGPWR
jgi:DNA-binding SARP family transcriptional activator